MTALARSIAVMIGIAVCCPTAAADSWKRYGTRIHVSPNGLHYAVVDGTSFDSKSCGRAPSTIHMVRRAADRPALKPRTIATRDLPEQGPAGLIDTGDELVASVRLDQVPSVTFVLDDGRIVLVDSYGSLGRAALVVVLDDTGDVLFSLPPDKVFDGFARRFSGSVSSVYWLASSWIDEPRNELVLLTTDKGAKSVHLATAAVSDVDRAAALLSPTGAETEAELCSMWEMSFEERLPGAVERARGVIVDDALPLSVRIRAAATVGVVDREAVRSMFLSAIQAADGRVSRWTWEHLGEVLGAEACPLYREALEATEGGIRAPVSSLVAGMARIGAEAVDPVVDMLLEEGSGTRDNSWPAAKVMSMLEQDFTATGRIPLRDYRPFGEDVKALQSLRDDGDLSTLSTLLARKSYMFSQGSELHCFLALPALVQLQRQPDGRAAHPLADYLAVLHEHPHNVPQWDARLREAAVRALHACTGLELGDDPAGWQAALAR